MLYIFPGDLSKGRSSHGEGNPFGVRPTSAGFRPQEIAEDLASQQSKEPLKRARAHGAGVIALTVSGGYQSQKMGLFLFNPPLRG